eukprot:GHVH01010775.1.p1 GENE.GHVH01010775.1~~GHVH01010775.1.p1  ORF type:complete len:547 (+),score=60.15 GHVH01010775.1:116-1642(+)
MAITGSPNTPACCSNTTSDGELKYTGNRKGKALSFKTVQDMSAFISTSDIDLIDACFSDPMGMWHHMTFTPSQCELKDLINGWAFDGSSIRLFKSIEESDMIMKPDPSTCFVDPFTKHKVLHVTCEVREADGAEFDRCPRTVLGRTNRYITEALGLCSDIVVGPELEFFIFDNVTYTNSANETSFCVETCEGRWNTGNKSSTNLGHRAPRKGFYAPMFPIDSACDDRADMLLALDDLGIPAEKHHHEVACGQHELGITCSTALETADNCMLFKYVVKSSAAMKGKSATFMPKPICGDNGSGMHTHVSLWKGDTNMFYDEHGSYHQLSQTALHFIAGLLHHAPAVLAFTCPTVNSYKRLVPGFEAPNLLCYSAGNRSACLRIPIVGKNEWRAKRIEFRCPDGSSNPYLAIAAIVLAGVDGIQKKMVPPVPLDKDLYTLDANSISKMVLKTAPENLKAALDALQKDNDFLTVGGCFSESFLKAYIQFKTAEYYSVINVPTPKEFENYYHC